MCSQLALPVLILAASLLPDNKRWGCVPIAAFAVCCFTERSNPGWLMSHRGVCLCVHECALWAFISVRPICRTIYLAQSSHSYRYTHTRTHTQRHCLPSERKDGCFHTSLHLQFRMAVCSIFFGLCYNFALSKWFVGLVLGRKWKACISTFTPINVSRACMYHRRRQPAVRVWFMRFVSAEWCPVFLLSWQHLHLRALSIETQDQCISAELSHPHMHNSFAVHEHGDDGRPTGKSLYSHSIKL